MLADVFESFKNICLKIYELDTDHFLTAPGLTGQIALKNTKVKLDILTNTAMLLIVEIGIRDRICEGYANMPKLTANT